MSGIQAKITRHAETGKQPIMKKLVNLWQSDPDIRIIREGHYKLLLLCSMYPQVPSWLHQGPWDSHHPCAHAGLYSIGFRNLDLCGGARALPGTTDPS